MLENAEYPSLDELIDLKDHGIDYELIYDRLIFNNTDVINKLDSVAESVRKLPFFLMSTNPFRIDIIMEMVHSDLKPTKNIHL